MIKQHTIVSFAQPQCTESKALFLLISAKVDQYFQNAILVHEGKGEDAVRPH
jgi:hypothetical protein